MACRRELLRVLLIAVALVPPLAIAAAPAPNNDPGKLVQCWTDDHGNRVCGDRVPPGDARRARELYDRRGVVKRVVAAQKSPEEYAAAEQARRDAEARGAKDRFLLQTYQTPEEIERARDDRLSALDGRLELARKNLNDSAAALDDLRKRSADPNDAKAAAWLHNQIATFDKAHTDNQTAIDSILAERAKTTADFNQQVTRFRELRAAGTHTPE
jgi:hypothetical protein